MTQLTIFDLDKQGNLTPEAAERTRPWDRILREWSTAYKGVDEDLRPITYDHTVICCEAIVTRKVDLKMKKLRGYLVTMLTTRLDADGGNDTYIEFEETFLPKERDKALEYHAYVVGTVDHVWRNAAEKSLKATRQAKSREDLFECPFCGFLSLEFFETCDGCGKRFMRIVGGDK